MFADGSVEFKDVCFSYSKGNGNFVLSDISFSIKPGQTVGIIGGTGSSKTTLVNLIPRLYDASSGEVLAGGKNVREYSLKALRNSVAVVLQKNVLFSGTIKENLLWGNANASDEEIAAACRAADAADFILSFPEKYDTVLGQGGVNLSGGQKQRLCIARALLKNPKILILDDSTSAVDTATEKRIRDALRKLCPDRCQQRQRSPLQPQLRKQRSILQLRRVCLHGEQAHREGSSHQHRWHRILQPQP